MKKAIKLFVAVVVTISAIHVNASETFSVDVVEGKRFRLEVKDVTGTVTSFVKDEEGQILHRNTVKKNVFKIVYDFSALESGRYELVVRDDHKVQTLPVVVTVDGLEIDKSGYKKTFLPNLERIEDGVMVTLLSDGENELYVNILGKDGTVIKTDKVDGKSGLIGRKYKFLPGEYGITVISDEFAKTSYLAIK